MTITGEGGRLVWGYAEAAVLHPWTVSKTEGQWTLTAKVVVVDNFRVSQHPLMFVTPNQWRWPVEELQIQDGTLTARLGNRENTNGQRS